MHTTKAMIVGVAALLAASTAFGSSGAKDNATDNAKTLNKATIVLSEIRNAPDNGIPDSVWNRTECVVVIPGMKKAGFIVGGEYGEGVMSCKRGNAWGAPIFMQLAKGSAGFQIGVSSTDLVLLVMNRQGVQKLLNNKVTLGGDASIAAGPVGRTASAGTDAQMTAEMLSYSRSKGLFAGIDLSGGTLKPDTDANAVMYGATADARSIALGTQAVTMTAEGRAFTNALSQGVRATTGVKPKPRY
jgi:SH3 domain-containing YSC84-like protein 1